MATTTTYLQMRTVRWCSSSACNWTVYDLRPAIEFHALDGRDSTLLIIVFESSGRSRWTPEAAALKDNELYAAIAIHPETNAEEVNMEMETAQDSAALMLWDSAVGLLLPKPLILHFEPQTCADNSQPTHDYNLRLHFDVCSSAAFQVEVFPPMLVLVLLLDAAECASLSSLSRSVGLCLGILLMSLVWNSRRRTLAVARDPFEVTADKRFSALGRSAFEQRGSNWGLGGALGKAGLSLCCIRSILSIRSIVYAALKPQLLCFFLNFCCLSFPFSLS